MVSTVSGCSPRGHSDVDRSAMAAVRPWYDQRLTMPPVPPVKAVARRQARSLASLPLFTNMTVSRPGGMPAMIRSARTTASCRYRVLVLSRPAWRAMASTTAGWAWPTTGTLL